MLTNWLANMFVRYIIMVCAFFGHRDAPSEIRDRIKETVIDLIEERGVTKFYVGNNGNFDRMALSVLKELSGMYPQINYYVVYAYLPEKGGEDFEHTTYPEGIETVPKRFAIDYRNRRIVGQADIVVAYVGRSFGGAAKFVDMAERQGKDVINLCKCYI